MSQAANFDSKLQDKIDRIDELNRLLKQTQSNLEHFREASREQRLIDKELSEQRQRELEQTIACLRDDLGIQTNEVNALKIRHETACNDKETLHTECIKLEKQISNIKLKLTDTEKEQIKSEQMQRHWQGEYQTAQEKLACQNEKLINLEKQIAIATQH